MATSTLTTPTIPPTTPPPVTPPNINDVQAQQNAALTASATKLPYQTADQANAASGLPSNTNPTTGVPYGSPNSNNPNPNAITGNSNTASSNAAPPSGATVYYTSSGQPYTTDAKGNVTYYSNNPTSPSGSTGNANVDALTKSYADQAAAAKTFGNAVTNIENGTTPLNPGEQAQIDALKASFQQLIDQQTLVNTGATGTANIRGYQGGAAEYDPNFQTNEVGSVMAAGANKIADLQTKEASAIAALTESLQNNDIANLKTAWDAYDQAAQDTQAGLKVAIADTQAAINDAHIQSVMASGVTDPKDILAELQKEGYTDISADDISKTISALSPDAADIYKTAQDAAANGADESTVQAIMSAPDKATALSIAAKGNVANNTILTLISKYPDAGIVPGDTVEQATAKIQQSPTYTIAQKSAAADLAYKQAQTQQIIDSTTGVGGVGSNYTPVTMTGDNTPNAAQQASFLAALPTDLATLVKGVANYQINPNSIPTRNYRGVGGLTQSQVLTLVSEYDPSFSQQNYASRQALMTNFTSGKYSQNINALNTAVGHITDLLSNFAKVGNTSFTPYNWLKNETAGILGSGAPGQANLNIKAATSELASVFKGSGATDQEISSLGTLDVNSSPAQVNAYIETATQLLASRLAALEDTYTSGMGKAPSTPFLSNTSQQNLLKLQQSGLNIQIPELANSPYVKIQNFHDASPENAQLLDGIMANHPEFQNNPQAAIEYLNQQGIEL